MLLTMCQLRLDSQPGRASMSITNRRHLEVSRRDAICAGVHQCWTQLLRAMTPEQFARSVHHPETGKNVVLSDALCYYAWHSRHHTAQITWLREHYGW